MSNGDNSSQTQSIPKLFIENLNRRVYFKHEMAKPELFVIMAKRTVVNVKLTLNVCSDSNRSAFYLNNVKFSFD